MEAWSPRLPAASRTFPPRAGPAAIFPVEGRLSDPQPRRRRLPLALAITLLAPPAALVAAEATHPVGYVTPYDLATPGDCLLAHLVAPAASGDVPDWAKTLLGGLPGQVGDWVGQYLDAKAMAGVITEAFPVEGQPPLRPVEDLVADCARALGVERPAVYVRNHPMTRIYAVRSGGRHHLVLTSGLLNLFEGRPGELKFVVGRELGHIKCGHADLRQKAYAILSALQAINAAVVPDRFQAALPTLALGRLFTWCREAEFTADRAGLLCCSEPEAAYGAIMRLQHGLRAASPWIDPAAEGFDPRAVIRQFREWQYQPFVRFVLDLKEQPLDHPYYQERVAMLRDWAETGAYRALLERRVDPSAGQLLEVVAIRAYELAPEGEVADPYVIVTDGDRQVLRTRYAAAAREAEWTGFRATDAGVDQPRAFGDGRPLFFEIWDADYGDDAFIGGFVIYPRRRDAVPEWDGGHVAEYTAKVLWDWNDARAVSRPGHARVRVRFTRREEPAAGGAGDEGRKR